MNEIKISEAEYLRIMQRRLGLPTEGLAHIFNMSYQEYLIVLKVGCTPTKALLENNRSIDNFLEKFEFEANLYHEKGVFQPKNPLELAIGELIYILRKRKHKMNLVAVSKIIGISHMPMAQLESKNKIPSDWKKLKLLLDFFNFDSEIFFRDEKFILKEGFSKAENENQLTAYY